jgi:hypothetical protein
MPYIKKIDLLRSEIQTFPPLNFIFLLKKRGGDLNIQKLNPPPFPNK